MGTLTPSEREIALHRRMFSEKTRLIGIEGLIYEIRRYNQTYKLDLDQLEYYDPIEVQFLFESMPAIKTLRGLGWYVEDEETLPCIAYLPWEINGKISLPTVGSLLAMVDPISKMERKFQIMDVNANTYYMINYIVKLVPFRDEVKLTGKQTNPEEADDPGYEYINI